MPPNVLQLKDPRHNPEEGVFDLFEHDATDDPFYVNQIDLVEFINRLDTACANIGSSLKLIYLDKFRAEALESMELQLMTQIMNYENMYDKELHYNENTKLQKRTEA